MAITVPYSLDLGAHEDAKAATPGTTVTPVTGKAKVFLGASVPPGRRQAYVGSLKVAFRALMNEQARKGGAGTNLVAFAHYANASSRNVTINADDSGIAATDVAISISSTFNDRGATHLYKETFDQLINVLLEKTKAN